MNGVGQMNDWHVFRGTGTPHEWALPEAPPWRAFDGEVTTGPTAAEPPSWRPADIERARNYQVDPEVIDLVNASIYLRRPMLITGKPGVGKSTLALAIAYELGLGPVLRWPITSRSTLKDGVYGYDALSRLHDSGLPGTGRLDIGRYITIGPLGTALLPSVRPRVLLIDEIDKCDLDLPNDLLTAFEEGEVTIPELDRIAKEQPSVEITTADGQTRPVAGGRIRCREFPIVVLTSNREREFPAAFLRRCVQLHIGQPDAARLEKIVAARLGPDMSATAADLVSVFLNRSSAADLATDQLLNAVYLTFHAAREPGPDRIVLAERLMQDLGAPPE
jgi:MoxR-like ATPase